MILLGVLLKGQSVLFSFFLSSSPFLLYGIQCYGWNISSHFESQSNFGVGRNED